MTTWVVGDIHGCAEELSRLLARLQLGPADRLVSVGDLFHRGPDPVGVMDQLAALRAPFVLGNHELAVLQRAGLAPKSSRVDPAHARPPPRSEFPELDGSDLDGDGGTPCDVAPHERARILHYLQTHSGFFLRDTAIENAAPTAEGQAWCVVHASRALGAALEDSTIKELVSRRHLDLPGRPWWYEHYRGPELVLFGHTPSALPRAWRVGGRLVALGLDTGCVYGGRLSAYSPELDELVSVAAAKAYAKAR
ncbi:MAG: metallophosphoesterase [Planctomycetota bacterium]